jgi:hypothetical protein
MLRIIPLMILIAILLSKQSIVFADGSISVSASKTTLLIHEETTGTISITLPEKPEDTDEIRYSGNVTAGSPSVSGTYTPFSTEQNPNPQSSAESGVTNLSSSSFKFTGSNAGTWEETFSVGFSSLSTEVYDPETDSWNAGDPYSFFNAETSITFTVKLCEQKCSGDVVAIIPFGL